MAIAIVLLHSSDSAQQVLPLMWLSCTFNSCIAHAPESTRFASNGLRELYGVQKFELTGVHEGKPSKSGARLVALRQKPPFGGAFQGSTLTKPS